MPFDRFVEGIATSDFSMPISVECRYCGKMLTVGDHVGGKRFRCPGCLEIIEAPLAPPARPVEVTTSPKPAAPKTVPRARSRWSSFRSSQQSHQREPAAPVVENPMLWTVSSYDYPEAPMPEREVPSVEDLRKTNPELFEEYDRIVNECLTFLIGFGVIIAGFFSFAYFSDNAPSDPDRHRALFYGALTVAGACIVSGFLCMTKWRAVLIVVAICSATFGLVILMLALVAGKALLLPGFGMCIVCKKLISAVLAYPSI